MSKQKVARYYTAKEYGNRYMGRAFINRNTYLGLCDWLFGGNLLKIGDRVLTDERELRI